MTGECSRMRRKAWRNLLVTAINAGQSSYHVPPGRQHPIGGKLFMRPILGLRTEATFRDAGWDEISINITLFSEEKHSVIEDPFLWMAADVAARAQGWLERRDGRYLQTGGTLFRCRRKLLKPLSELDVSPEGFLDSGPFRF